MFFLSLSPSMLNYICICNGNLQYIELLILFLARQSSKLSIERAVQMGEKREKQQSFIHSSWLSFTTGTDFGAQTLRTQCHDGSLCTYLEIKETLFAMLLIYFYVTPKPQAPPIEKDPTIIGYEPMSLGASPSGSHSLSISPSTTSTPLCASSVTVRPRPPSSESLPSISLKLAGRTFPSPSPPTLSGGRAKNQIF
jgi:hypothetical protein